MRTILTAAAAVLAVLLTADVASAQRPGGPGGPGGPGRGGKPSFDRLLEAFDDNDDGELTEDEVPPRVWWRLKNADADRNGSVTRKEFESFVPSGRP